MLNVNNLTIGYKSKKQTNAVFLNLNFALSVGNFVGVIGNNGIGKSTFLNTITGSIIPLNGEISINNRSLKNVTTSELSKLIAIVNTDKVSGFNLTTYDVVASGRTPYLNFLGKLSSHDNEIINYCITQLNITLIKNKLMDELSDGQRQKVMIAKALAQQTPIIVLDEPTAFLDYNSKHQLFKTLKELAINQHKLIIVSSHDLDLMKQYITHTIEFCDDGNYLFY